MAAIRSGKVRGIGGLVALGWAAACASTQSGYGGESHFLCVKDADCATLAGHQVCVLVDPTSKQGECKPLATSDASGTGGAGGGTTNTAGGAGDASHPRPAAYCSAPQRATYPAPPATSGTSSPNLEVVAAMYTIDMGDAPPGPVEPTHYLGIGFDLDDTCTTATNLGAGTCKLPPYDFGVIDGPGGIDNAFGSLVQKLREQLADFSSDHYSQALQTGKSNTVLHLENWNGQANDTQVTFSMMTAAPFDSFSRGAKPTWDGTDAWPIAESSVNGSVALPKFVDRNAYVSNYELVATLEAAPFRMDVGLTSIQDVKLDLSLAAAFVVCTIVPVESGKWGYTFSKCTLAGRWAANSLVQQIGQFPNPLDNNKPLCRGSQTYETFKKEICSQVDLNADPTQAPTKPCNALSLGMTFTTKPALLGDLYPLAPLEDPCPADPALNPKYDCCESIGAPDAGELAACGFSSPFDAGPAPSGTGGTGPADASVPPG